MISVAPMRQFSIQDEGCHVSRPRELALMLIWIRDRRRDEPVIVAGMGKGSDSRERTDLAEGEGSGGDALERIASLLGCSPTAFLKDGVFSPEAEAAELLRIWCAMENGEDRRRVLEFARKLAGS